LKVDKTRNGMNRWASCWTRWKEGRESKEWDEFGSEEEWKSKAVLVEVHSLLGSSSPATDSC
jgi:hypothetical protein